MSHSAEKRGRGTLFDLKTCILLQNNKKLIGVPFGTFEIFRKNVAQCRKKSKGDPLFSAGCVGYVKKVKNERMDPLHSVSFGPLDGRGALGGFRIVSKKWTDQCEYCSL